MANKKKSTETSGVRQRTHQGIDKIMDKADSINESGKKVIGNVKDKTIMMKENVEGYIQDNLKKSMLIAMGLGVVVGAIFITAMRRNR